MAVHHEDNGFTQMRELNHEGLSALIQASVVSIEAIENFIRWTV